MTKFKSKGQITSPLSLLPPKPGIWLDQVVPEFNDGNRTLINGAIDRIREWRKLVSEPRAPPGAAAPSRGPCLRPGSASAFVAAQQPLLLHQL